MTAALILCPLELRTPAYLDHRAEWGRLHVLVAKLYETVDPEYEDVANINYGTHVGERMVSI